MKRYSNLLAPDLTSSIGRYCIVLPLDAQADAINVSGALALAVCISQCGGPHVESQVFGPRPRIGYRVHSRSPYRGGSGGIFDLGMGARSSLEGS